MEIDSEANAARIRRIEDAKVAAETARTDIYRTLPSSVILGLAARELAQNLDQIDHLSITPDLIGPLLSHVRQWQAEAKQHGQDA